MPGRFVDQVQASPVEVKLTRWYWKSLQQAGTLINKTEGYLQLDAGAIILAMGCRERTRGAIGIRATGLPASLPPVPRSAM
jgi:hypothetical protein